jgi:hypothetical protein
MSFWNSNVAIVTSWAETARLKAVHSGKWVLFRGSRKTDGMMRSTCTAAMPWSPIGKNRVPGGVA